MSWGAMDGMGGDGWLWEVSTFNFLTLQIGTAEARAEEDLSWPGRRFLGTLM